MSLRIDAEQSQVLVVDIQQRLAPHLFEVDAMLHNSVHVLKAATLFGVPITVAEQYPKGLGNSVDAIKPFINVAVYEKTSFSCFGAEPLSEALKELSQQGHNTLIVIGCEAHVCVLQSVIDALEQDYRVIVVADAVTSRTEQDALLAQARLTKAGAEYVSTEMLLFEWTKGKDCKHFKAISEMLK